MIDILLLAGVALGALSVLLAIVSLARTRAPRGAAITLVLGIALIFAATWLGRQPFNMASVMESWQRLRSGQVTMEGIPGLAPETPAVEAAPEAPAADPAEEATAATAEAPAETPAEAPAEAAPEEAPADAAAEAAAPAAETPTAETPAAEPPAEGQPSTN